jgi:hypothetical protein
VTAIGIKEHAIVRTWQWLLRHNVGVHKLRSRLPVSAVENKNDVEEYRGHVSRFLEAMLLVHSTNKASPERGSKELLHCSQYQACNVTICKHFCCILHCIVAMKW